MDVEIGVVDYRDHRGKPRGKLVFNYTGERRDGSTQEVAEDIASEFYEWTSNTRDVGVSLNLDRITGSWSLLRSKLGDELSLTIEIDYRDEEAVVQENRVYLTKSDLDEAAELAEEFYEHLLEEN